MRLIGLGLLGIGLIGLGLGLGSFYQTDRYGNHYLVNLSFPGNHRLVKNFYLNGTKTNSTDVISNLDTIRLSRWYKCPNLNTEVVVFAPNINDIEINASMDVWNFSVTKGYQTVLLLHSNATRDAFLNYSRCPNLKSLFYDGDADSQAIVTADGLVYYSDIELLDWNYQVISYWLACEAYNDPMLQSVTMVRPRRWAAGINDLLIGPSDQAAAEAMKSALSGAPLDQSFLEALAKYDTSSDRWGFGGFGSP